MGNAGPSTPLRCGRDDKEGEIAGSVGMTRVGARFIPRPNGRTWGTRRIWGAARRCRSLHSLRSVGMTRGRDCRLGRDDKDQGCGAAAGMTNLCR